MDFLDTSTLIRYFTGDDLHKASQCERLFREARAGKVTLWVSHLVIAEAVWVLSKTFEMPRRAIVEHLSRLLNTPHVVCDDAPTVLAALALYGTTHMSFVDAYHATLLPARGITTFYSYDTDFDQVTGITRRAP